MTCKCQYLSVVLSLVRARLDDAKSPAAGMDILLFAGRRRALIDDMNGLWDRLEDRGNAPSPSDVWGWL